MEQILHLLFDLLDWHNYPDPAVKARKLYSARERICEEGVLDLVLAIDSELWRLTLDLPEEDRQYLRRQGFQFPDELDNVPKMLRSQNDDGDE